MGVKKLQSAEGRIGRRASFLWVSKNSAESVLQESFDEGIKRAAAFGLNLSAAAFL